ncbi:GNAT family N-acetyltransferase [Streptomyces violascens]|uniref:GNAT family N-acetyltransferase n=1 Tax=Streptomyces violascens TaxID=67381 RepID=UPI0037ACC2F1
MSSYGWHLTRDLDDFLARAGGFLRSRPALHTMPLTVTESLRTRGAHAVGGEVPFFGWLERPGGIRAAFYRKPPGRLSLTPLDPEHADTLAARLAEPVLPTLGTSSPVSGQHRVRLYRLGTLTPPKPFPAGRGRVAGGRDREQVRHWCREFAAAVGEAVPTGADSWAGTRFADKGFTFWEAPDGTPVSMAGVTSMVAGQVRVDPVYTPAHLRGRGYAAAVSAEVTRAALAAGAREVVLFADVANPTSNGLYQRLGDLPVAEFVAFDFS